VRTLHFYDQIGLLRPASYGENGYRYYEKEQLFRLQQILFYRELDFPLAQVMRILQSSRFDQLQALREHREKLQERGKRLGALVLTIDRTLAHLQGEVTMKDKDLYRGFSARKQREYEAYLTEKGGETARAAIASSRQRTQGWGKAEFAKAQGEIDAIHRELTALLQQGKAPADADVQAVIPRHYAWVCQFWTPDKRSYPGLGELYQEHPDFQKTYAAYDPRLAAFLAEAMRVFARRALS
jgi:DNA-binding transcriptional MerR regulator